MKKKREDRRMAVSSVFGRVIAGLALLGAMAAVEARADYPDKPVRVIVPTAAGGSTDLVARIMQMTLDRTKGLPQPLVVVNNGAAGGTVGTRMIKDADKDGYTIGIWHMGLLTAPAMGVVDYDHNAYELVGQIGRIQIGLGVPESSPYKTIQDLVAAAKAKPDTVTVATNIGLLPHFVPLMFAKDAGISFRFVQSGGGAVRLKSLLGGHTEMSLFSVPEFVNFKANGIRPLVVFSEERSPLLPDVPTAKELGWPTIFEERILVLAPKGTPPERLKVLAEAMKASLDDPDVVERYKAQGIDRVFIPGPELQKVLDDTNVGIKVVAEEVKRAQAEKAKAAQ
jgi:putative tricarboxylic transport membrane protein